MRRVLVLLVAGTLVSGLAAAYAASAKRPGSAGTGVRTEAVRDTA
ncbi:hypothetical protein [Sphingomonas baiyangensis]|nr:hypothetical protein [Sphingomonas baiyangensis]